jgi:hypothetical protein
VSQEKLLTDFHGGMNSLAGVDKIDPTECLLAENCRLDEAGNVAVAGATTRQNIAPYVSSGTSSNIHSLFWNPAIGAVAGVDKDVFTGRVLSSMTDVSVGTNLNSQKMSFASAPNRVYFDIGNVGYWSDMTNLLTVDYPPPAAGAAGGGFTDAAGFFDGSKTSSNYGFTLFRL